ncbi:C39 family peptidase [Oscillospiraceae bacterium OttesenSCG-928-F05]|nr:C39 family peptidase [Oscillospiraceae bacterium OttesenSCG-928-F05]
MSEMTDREQIAYLNSDACTLAEADKSALLWKLTVSDAELAAYVKALTLEAQSFNSAKAAASGWMYEVGAGSAKQENSYYCVPASLQNAMYLDSKGYGKTQAYWAGKLGTTTTGSGFSRVVDIVNDTTYVTRTWNFAVRSIGQGVTPLTSSNIKGCFVATLSTGKPVFVSTKNMLVNGGHCVLVDAIDSSQTLVRVVDPYRPLYNSNYSVKVNYNVSTLWSYISSHPDGLGSIAW